MKDNKENLQVIRQVVNVFKEKTDFEKGLVIGLMINEDFWPRSKTEMAAGERLNNKTMERG